MALRPSAGNAFLLFCDGKDLGNGQQDGEVAKHLQPCALLTAVHGVNMLTRHKHWVGQRLASVGRQGRLILHGFDRAEYSRCSDLLEGRGCCACLHGDHTVAHRYDRHVCDPARRPGDHFPGDSGDCAPPARSLLPRAGFGEVLDEHILGQKWPDLNNPPEMLRESVSLMCAPAAIWRSAFGPKRMKFAWSNFDGHLNTALDQDKRLQPACSERWKLKVRS